MYYHQLIMGTFWWINVKALPTNNNYIKVDVNDLDNFPVPKIIENYIRKLAFHRIINFDLNNITCQEV